MPSQYDSKGQLRATFTLRELGKAQHALSGGVPGILVRAALLTVFMYLLVIAYSLMGNTGLIFVSGLFLVSVFIPTFLGMTKKRWIKRKHSAESFRQELEPRVQREEA